MLRCCARLTVATATQSHTDRGFGAAEVALAVFLIAVFAFSSLGASSAQIVRLRTLDLILNAVVAIGMVLFVAAFLETTPLQPQRANRSGPAQFYQSLSHWACPPDFRLPPHHFCRVADGALLGSGSSRQGIIELFSGSQSMEQRVIIILLATAIAPWPRNSSSVSFFTGSCGVISVVALDSSFRRFFLLRFTCTCRLSRRSLLSGSVLLWPTSGADRCWSR